MLGTKSAFIFFRLSFLFFGDPETKEFSNKERYFGQFLLMLSFVYLIRYWTSISYKSNFRTYIKIVIYCTNYWKYFFAVTVLVKLSKDVTHLYHTLFRKNKTNTIFCDIISSKF